LRQRIEDKDDLESKIADLEKAYTKELKAQEAVIERLEAAYMRQRRDLVFQVTVLERANVRDFPNVMGKRTRLGLAAGGAGGGGGGASAGITISARGGSSGGGAPTPRTSLKKFYDNLTQEQQQHLNKLGCVNRKGEFLKTVYFTDGDWAMFPANAMYTASQMAVALEDTYKLVTDVRSEARSSSNSAR
jgi:hypothetical protein